MNFVSNLLDISANKIRTNWKLCKRLFSIFEYKEKIKYIYKSFDLIQMTEKAHTNSGHCLSFLCGMRRMDISYHQITNTSYITTIIKRKATLHIH